MIEIRFERPIEGLRYAMDLLVCLCGCQPIGRVMLDARGNVEACRVPEADAREVEVRFAAFRPVRVQDGK